MGDNREVSRDSRNGLGYIEEDNIIGKVEFVYYPFQNENNRISGRGAKPHLLKFHFIFFKKPFGLNDMKNLCLDSSIMKLLFLVKNSSTASIGPGPQSGRSGCPLMEVSSTII